MFVAELRKAAKTSKWVRIPLGSHCHFIGKLRLIERFNLSKAGWSLGYVSAVDSRGRTIWIVDAHRGDGQRFVVHADEKLSAFVELESAVLRASG
jgi:hypothetical protein